MKLPMSASELVLAAVVVGGIGIAGWQLFGSGGSSGRAAAAIKLPDFSAQALAGRSAFDANCLVCHGQNAAGTALGPPLMHDIYNPGHHPDQSIASAVRRGVPQHHWRFGDMPPQPQVSDEQLAQIVPYMRELQQANGILYRAHQM